jgi:hypothetical protein
LRNGVYGYWISKPGIDVTMAQPGDFMLDTSSQVFQSVMKGDTLIMSEGQATIPPGTYGTTVSLPGQFAGFSNLPMMATYYMLSNTGVYYSAENISNTYLKFNVVGGVLRLNVIFRAAGGTGTPQVSFDHHAAWTIFRGQF